MKRTGTPDYFNIAKDGLEKSVEELELIDPKLVNTIRCVTYPYQGPPDGRDRVTASAEHALLQRRDSAVS